MSKKRVNLYIDEELYRSAKVEAAETDSSMSAIVEDGLRKRKERRDREWITPAVAARDFEKAMEKIDVGGKDGCDE